jgi:hypothetical protein
MMPDFLIGLVVGTPIGILIGLYLPDEWRWFKVTVRRVGRKGGT